MSFLPRRILSFSPAIQQIQCVRWKGHSKWQNIKHTKEAKDGERMRMSARYTYLIKAACKENNFQTDLKINKPLAKVVKEALAQGVAKSTVEKAISNCKLGGDVAILTEVRGPGRTALIVEAIGTNAGNVSTEVNGILRKNGGKAEKGILNLFTKKGVIVIAKNDLSFDKVEEDAIEFGAEEVEEEEDSFTFLTTPDDFSDVLTNVKEKYEVGYSQIEYIPEMYPDLTKRDKALNKGLIDALENSSLVTAVHHNVIFK